MIIETKRFRTCIKPETQLQQFYNASTYNRYQYWCEKEKEWEKYICNRTATCIIVNWWIIARSIDTAQHYPFPVLPSESPERTVEVIVWLHDLVIPYHDYHCLEKVLEIIVLVYGIKWFIVYWCDLDLPKQLWN